LSNVSAVVVNGYYLYAGSGAVGAIYVVDIDPYSDTFEQVVSTIRLPNAPHGVLGMAVNSAGTRRYGTEPQTTLYGGYFTGDRVPGHIAVINVDPFDEPFDPAVSNPNKWNQVLAELDAGIQPNTIVAAGDPDRMAFTNMLDVNHGFSTIEVTN